MYRNARTANVLENTLNVDNRVALLLAFWVKKTGGKMMSYFRKSRNMNFLQFLLYPSNKIQPFFHFTAIMQVETESSERIKMFVMIYFSHSL